jgi:hypothetical protein
VRVLSTPANGSTHISQSQQKYQQLTSSLTNSSSREMSRHAAYKRMGRQYHVACNADPALPAPSLVNSVACMRENGHCDSPDSVADDDGRLRVALKAQWPYLDAGLAGHYGDVTAIDVDGGSVSRCQGSECDDSEPAMFLPGPRAVHVLPPCTQRLYGHGMDAGRPGHIRHSSGPRPRPRRRRARRASAACGPVQAPGMSRLWARARRLGPRLRHEAKMAFKTLGSAWLE